MFFLHAKVRKKKKQKNKKKKEERRCSYSLATV